MEATKQSCLDANDEEHADVNEVMEKLCSVLRDVSRQHWKVELPVIEAVQYTHYAVGEWYGWHVDVGECAGPHRIVSASVELDDPKDYYGGGLKFFDHTLANPSPEGNDDTIPLDDVPQGKNCLVGQSVDLW